MSHYRPKLGTVNASDEYILLQDRDTASAKTRPLEIIEPEQSWRDGYHVGVLCCTVTAAVVLLINVILCAVASAKHEIAGGFGTLFESDCQKVKRVNLWLHLLINILSTLLLGASNYTMQCVSAPTRNDIDKAHRNHSWMDIGIPSVRNLGRISWPRKILWCCLILSSVPLHLIYNSVIFSSISIASSNVFLVTNDFLAGAPYTSPDPDNPVDADTLSRLQGFRDWARVNDSSKVSLNSKACINTYGKSDLISEWGDSLAILERQSTGNSFVAVSGAPEIASHKFARIFCGYTALICKGNNLTYYENLVSQPISSCVGTKVNQHCQVRFSVGLMIGVIICNVIKLFCMSLVVWKADPRLLVTLGDALVSFLENPDPTTRGKCLLSKSDIHKWPTEAANLHVQYKNRRHFRFASASPMRWITVTLLCAVTLGITAALLSIGNGALENRFSNPYSLGFGAVNPQAVVELSLGNIVGLVLIANCPQLILSFLYFAYNGLWTCMLLVEEWFGYAKEGKPLRVTSPRGSQRSTYRLQLPYRYGIPLLIISAVLYWLVSQSIFLVVLYRYLPDDTLDPNPDNNLIACGYSPSAILTTIIVGSVVLLAGILNGFRPYRRTGMPLASSCSAAISAACHPPPGDDNASKKAVNWGAVTDESGDAENDALISESRFSQNGGITNRVDRKRPKVGHCSFTSFTVAEPVEHEPYAGMSKIE